MEIAGKTVLVTGSSSGLGAACTQRLLEQGAHVIGLDRTAQPPWQSTWAGPDQWQLRYLHGLGDVTDETSVQSIVQRGIDRFGELSGVVCCAGILHGERVLGKESTIASLDAF
ncbi:MAG: SDR family NAD(P)-dependent oxidoreductase, partial [Pirellula sp.]